MLNVNPSAPLLVSSNRDPVALAMARRLNPAQPDPVHARSVFDEQLEDPDYHRYLDAMASHGYGFI